MDIEISKAEFKSMYFKYAVPNSGWTVDYWNQSFEYEVLAKYYFEKPDSPLANRMMISSGSGSHRMFFLTEDAEESFSGKH